MPRKKKDPWTKQSFIEDARTRLLELMGLVRRHIDAVDGDGANGARGRGKGGRISRTAAEGHLRDVLSIMTEARNHTGIQQVCEKLNRQMISIILEANAGETDNTEQKKSKIIKKTITRRKSKVNKSDPTQYTYNTNIDLSNLTDNFILVRGKENIPKTNIRAKMKQKMKLNTPTTDNKKIIGDRPTQTYNTNIDLRNLTDNFTLVRGKEDIQKQNIRAKRNKKMKLNTSTADDSKNGDVSRSSFFLDTQSNEVAQCSRAHNEEVLLSNDTFILFSNIDDTVADPNYTITEDNNTDLSNQRSENQVTPAATRLILQEINKLYEVPNCSQAHNHTENAFLTNDNTLFSNIDDTVADPDYTIPKDSNTDLSNRRSENQLTPTATRFTLQELNKQSYEVTNCSQAHNYTEDALLTNDNTLFSNIDDTVADPDYILTKDYNTDLSNQRSDNTTILTETNFTPREINKQQAHLNKEGVDPTFCSEKIDIITESNTNKASDNRTEKLRSNINLRNEISSSKQTVDINYHNRHSSYQERNYLTHATPNSEEKFFKDIRTKHINRKNIIPSYNTLSYPVIEQTPKPDSGSKATVAENYSIDMDIDLTVSNRSNLINAGISDVTSQQDLLPDNSISSDTHNKSAERHPELYSGVVGYSKSHNSIQILKPSSNHDQRIATFQATPKICLQNDLVVRNKENALKTSVNNGKNPTANMYDFKRYNNDLRAIHNFKNSTLTKLSSIQNISINSSRQEIDTTAYGNTEHNAKDKILMDMKAQTIENRFSKININSDQQKIRKKACNNISQAKKNKSINALEPKKVKAEKKSKQSPKNKKCTEITGPILSYEWLEKIKFVRIPDDDEYIPITQENSNIWDPDYSIPDADFRI